MPTTAETVTRNAILVGTDREHAEELGAFHQNAEDTRDRTLDPEHVAAAEARLSKAQAEIQQIEQQRAQRRAAIRELEGKVIELARHRRLQSDFAAEFEFDETAAAGQVFAAWQNSVRGNDARSTSVYALAKAQFAEGIALAKHAGRYSKSLADEEAQQVKAIQSEAKKLDVRLEVLVNQLRIEAGPSKASRAPVDGERHSLIAAGFLDDIAAESASQN